MKKQFLLLLLCAWIGNGMFAQQKSISGTVFDDDGLGLPGVNVLIKGTQKGTITDPNGNYSLTDVSPEDILVFSMIGFAKQEIKVGSQAEINVDLVSSITGLEEVVVTGYGSSKRRDLTGSTVSAPVAEMMKAANASIDQSLQGRLAGVQVSAGDGKPGSGSTIKIRGASSITGTSNPLWVVDGFQLVEFDPGSLDPSDIESMEVLKGPSAIAIYGARGSNGVILITTKRGQSGKVNVNYNGYYGMQSVTKTLDVLTPLQYVDLRYEVAGAESAYRTFGPLSGYQKEDGSSINGVNWQDEVFRNTPVQNHSVSVNGGSEDTRFVLSYSWYDTKGIIEGSGFARDFVKLSLDQDLFNKKLKVGMNVSFTKSTTAGIFTSANILNNDGSGSSNRFNYLKDVVQGRPTGGLSQTNAELIQEPISLDDAGTEFMTNPIVTAKTVDRTEENNQLIWNGYAQFEIVKGLQLRMNGGFSRAFRDRRAFNEANAPKSIWNGYMSGEIETRLREYYSANAYLTYRKKIGGIHDFKFMLGSEYNNTTGGGVRTQALQFPEVNNGLDDLSAAAVIAASSYTLATDKLISQFGRVNYSLKDKYLATATLRRDGSSKFGSAYKFGVFPSVSGAWRFSEEAFVKNLGVFTNGKLRVEWGQVGNDRIPSGLSGATLGSVSYGLNNVIVPGVGANNMANPDLKWEAQEQTNMGLDLGFLDNKIRSSIDVYRKESKDLLLYAPIAASTGFDRIYRNIGTLRNEGVEFSLSVNIIDRELKWNADLNVTSYRTETVALAGEDFLYSSSAWDARANESKFANDFITMVGEPFGQMYGLVADGLFMASDFDANGEPLLDISPVAGEQAKVGYRKYIDQNGDDIINADDRVVLGNSIPDFFGGLTNNFSYKGFDLSAFLSFSYGSEVYNANRILYTSQLERDRNVLSEVANRWRTDRTDEENMAAGVTFRRWDDASQVLTDEYIEDGSFIRLQVLTLGYTLPSNITSRIGAQKVRFYVTGQNLYTWTNYSGFDPESSTRGDGLTPNVDFGAYPRTRAFLGGVSLTF
jgi:TonB-linked SusC/RagA family outer membrane protein